MRLLSFLDRYSPLLLPALIVGVYAVFAPGLSGPFILDDLVHLPKLNAVGGIDTLREVYQFALVGGGPTGRPISFLSLLINDNDWPSSPGGFKHTNLMIHLLNGVLVFVLIRNLSRIIETRWLHTTESRANAIALLGCLLWVLHPIHLSPTMMVIQRMTLLMALFSLLGLITYLKGRLIAEEHPIKGLVVMTLGVGGFGLLAALSKEPGVMLVSYVIALEVTVLAAVELRKPRYWKVWAGVFLYFPLIAVALYFVANSGQMDRLYLQRDFNMTERLLTESRVLVDYLRVIIVPSISESGPYHDDYLVSRGLFDPLSTFVAIGFIGLLLAGAIIMRRRWPLFAMAVLWFFLGHLLESTILPIELYFEHRNYLPMLGLVIALVIWLAHLSPVRIRKGAIYAAIAFILIEASIAHASSRIWGNEELIARVWAYENPSSVRAQQDAISFWMRAGEPGRALEHLNQAMETNADSATLFMNKVVMSRCVEGDILELTDEEMRTQIPTMRFEWGGVETLRYTINRMIKGANACDITPREFLSIIDLFLSNPRYARHDKARSFLYHQMSRVYRHMGDLDGTITNLDKAYEAFPKYEFPLNQAYFLMTAGLYEDALHYIEVARHTKPYNPYVRLWQDQHVGEMEKAIKAVQAGATPVFKFEGAGKMP